MQYNLKRLLLEPVIMVTEAKEFFIKMTISSYFEDTLEVIAAVLDIHNKIIR